MIRTILFDLDETLYPRGAGVMEQIRIRMIRYLRTRLHLSLAEAEALRRHYFLTYGTTMRGLQVHYHIDPDEYLHYVHNIRMDRYLHPNRDLDIVLASLPQQKIVFTNASREHAESVLASLDIRQHIDGIVDIRDMGYESKPVPDAYRRVCDRLGVRPEECLLVEDNLRNLRPAKELGMVTVLVDGDQADGSVDFTIHRIEEIGEVVRGLKSEE